MQLTQAIRERKSTRNFTDRPVSREDVARVIAAGVAAPSKGNSQIWEFIGVAGERKRAMDRMLHGLLTTDFIPSMTLGESPSPSPGEALLKAERRSRRNREEIGRLLSSSGQSFDSFMLEGTFTFFSAPVAVLVFVDEAFSKDLPHILSVGAAVQNMLLAATEMGLGSCWIGGVWRYTRQIRDLLEIPENKRLLSSVALGHPDPDAPLGRYKASRDDLGEFVRWVGFDEPPGEGPCR